MIMKKIEEKKTEVKEIVGEEEVGSQLPEELVKHYSSVGMALSTYRSGKLPKVVFGRAYESFFEIHGGVYGQSLFW